MVSDDDSRIAPILLRFPGPVTLHPSKTKWLFVLLGSIALSAGGYSMIKGGHPVWGWLGLIFFSLGIPVAITALLPGGSMLTLNSDGFEFVRFFRRSSRYLWQDTSGFAAWIFENNRIVVFDYPVPNNVAVRALAKFNQKHSGHVGGLPDTYGLTARELAELMTRWRERAVASGGQNKPRQPLRRVARFPIQLSNSDAYVSSRPAIAEKGDPERWWKGRDSTKTFSTTVARRVRHPSTMLRMVPLPVFTWEEGATLFLAITGSTNDFGK